MSRPSPSHLSRRTLITSVIGLVSFVASCSGDQPYCAYNWLGRATDACFEHEFQPGDIVLWGVAESGETPRTLRDRLAPQHLTPDQQSVIFGLLEFTITDGDGKDYYVTSDTDPEKEFVFSGGELVHFRLAQIVMVAEATQMSDEDDQFSLFDSEYVGDPNGEDRPPDMAFIVVQSDGRIRMPTAEEFRIEGYGTPDERWFYPLRPGSGERLVFVDVEVIHVET